MSNAHKNYAVPIVGTANFEEGFTIVDSDGNETVWVTTDDSGKPLRGAFVLLVRMPTNARQLRKFIRTCKHLNVFLRECRPDAVAVPAAWESLSPVDYVDDPSAPLGSRGIVTRPHVDPSPWRIALMRLDVIESFKQSPYVKEWREPDVTAHAPDARGSGQTKKSDSHSHHKHK